MGNDKLKEEIKIFATNGSAILSAYVLKRITERILESVFHKMAPKKPDEDEEIGWIEAIGWAAFTGALAGIIKLLVKRGMKIQLDKAL
jgi:hypothetical protein